MPTARREDRFFVMSSTGAIESGDPFIAEIERVVASESCPEEQSVEAPDRAAKTGRPPAQSGWLRASCARTVDYMETTIRRRLTEARPLADDVALTRREELTCR
jgi:hypothetical protein